MNDIIQTLFGEGKYLNVLQMGCRAFVMFFITLTLIRISGMRSIGQKSAFDSIIVILLGSVLSRAVVGASPFLPTVIAGIVISLLHKAIAIITVRNDIIGHIIKGHKTLLFTNNEIIQKNMIDSCISLKDLKEEIRLNINEDTTDHIEEIYMERSGRISIIKKHSN
jgi:uncharacterized membrane protein YcaP (DUF421 family)